MDKLEQVKLKLKEAKLELKKAKSELKEAKYLARLLYSIMRQFPTDPGDFHPKLEYENLPMWIHNLEDYDG